ncbi:alpha-L-rhamnosidase [Agriterribacter sp.]|uniref:alpha-L-rhamnosidase n=1 Tax=Agriterribacter sp. TaxID=2821509 RepID=UPI002C330FDB|nr:family 78 glycoside hydrolase catalytic domain [Agriterribacter sp.]HTN08028.1 family 78 glycoside hydrolase catalytic domain [Agriterribacter sp.]
MPHTKPLLLLCLLMCAVMAKADFLPDHLSCEQKINPCGVESAKPLLGWWISSAGRGFAQSAWQVLVATSPGKLNEKSADTWNSGRIASDYNNNNAFAGKTLQSGRKYYWKVRVWNSAGKVSAWSETAIFSTGILQQQEWDTSNWIAYAILPDSMKVIPGVHGNGNALGNKAIQRAVVPCFRKEFVLEKPVKEAFVFISGLGQYELHLNGEKVSDDFLLPGWTNYEKRCLYNTYEVTNRLKQGSNAIGAIVGTGFFYINRERYRKLVRAEGYPMLRAKLIVRFTDGSSKEIITDESWTTAPSPVLFTSIYGGEDYDANKEQAGWDMPGFADAGWKKVLITKGPGGQMRAQNDYPLKVMETFPVRTQTAIAKGKTVYDFGQNASGIVRLKIKGNKGDTIRITPAELLNDDGLPEQSASGKPYYFTYILKGGGIETWEPRFTYYGLRYALVEYISTAPAPQMMEVTMLHTRNSSPSAGSFTCSDSLFNNIYRLIDWAIKSNMASVATDCPHREKLGWLEQTHLVGASMRYAYDIRHLYTKIIDDMKEAQLPNGLVPDIAPEYVPFEGGFRDSPEWGSAAVIIPWYMYLWYGDKKALINAYDMIKRYVSYLNTKANDHILSYGLGDWYDLGPKDPGPSQLTPLALTATAIYYYDAVILGKTAALLGKDAEAKLYTGLSVKIKKAFNDKFFNKETQVYATGSQTAYAMPLFTGLVEEQYRERVFNNLVSAIHAGNKALTAGDIGYRYLVRALEDGNASRLLYEMNNRTDVPGYGYQIKHGATALTESWPALRFVSNNHMMLGHLMEWLYSGLGGINQQEDDHGFRKIRIAPQMVDGMDSVSASYSTPNGIIHTAWKKEGNKTVLTVTIPANTTAQVVLPALYTKNITAGNQPLIKNKWITHIQQKAGKVSFTIAAGNYIFAFNHNL